MEPLEPIATGPTSINYIGTSMHPTLKPGDRLHTIPYNGQVIRRGDVIVLTPPGGDSKIIHRVVSVDSLGMRTRGDNNTQVDAWILKPDQIVGRVVSARNGSRQRRVLGGPLGHVCALIIRAIHVINSSGSSLLRPAYERMAKSGIFRRWLPTPMKPRVISLNRAAGEELQILMGRRVIGRWLPGKTGWHIRRPFRLFVDEETLPENPAKGSVVRGQLSVANKDI